jgi:catechol 2,3-dioxygenase-like lactoylglutathione lyase family enzyme
MTRPRMQITGPVLDAADPLQLAEFYERLLGWPIVEREGPRPGYPPADAWAKVRSPEGQMKIEFQWDEHYTPPVWPTVPGTQQMMIHLDIGVDDLDAGVAWAIDAGARLAEHQPQEHVRVMLDPAGHPFCLFADP